MLKPLVRPTASQLDQAAVTRVQWTPECLGNAAATHTEMGAFPGLPNSIWAWGATQSFYEIAAGWKWWESIQTPSPFGGQCA